MCSNGNVMACRKKQQADTTTAIIIIFSLISVFYKGEDNEKISRASVLYILLCHAFCLILLHQAEQPTWAAVTSLGNLTFRTCHWSVLFPRNPQWAFLFSAVNTTWWDFIGMLLEADITLGTSLSVPFQLELMPSFFNLHHLGQSLVCVTLFASFHWLCLHLCCYL